MEHSESMLKHRTCLTGPVDKSVFRPCKHHCTVVILGDIGNCVEITINLDDEENAVRFGCGISSSETVTVCVVNV